MVSITIKIVVNDDDSDGTTMGVIMNDINETTIVMMMMNDSDETMINEHRRDGE